MSKDSLLCFDGDNFGLYYPWRQLSDANDSVDREIVTYVRSKGAYELPPALEQRRLVQLFLETVYPFYPVVPREQLKSINEIPLILLNAILLSVVRLDTTKKPEEIRDYCDTIYHRCKLLELLETNKVTLIQTYLLLSINEEGLDGANLSKQYISKACNYCGELALTTISATSKSSLSPQSSQTDLHTLGGRQYTESLLRRICWTAFACDRLVAATSGREMYFNLLDWNVDDLVIGDFEVTEEFDIFTNWLQIAKFIDRILSSYYRPLKGRVLDTTLKEDLINWTPTTQRANAENLLSIYHEYALILYLRCQIDPITVIGSEFEQDSGEFFQLIRSCSTQILQLASSQSLIHHIMVVHALLHVISLLRVESKIRTIKNNEYYIQTKTKSFDLLEKLSRTWWLAASSYRLCLEVFKDS